MDTDISDIQSSILKGGVSTETIAEGSQNQILPVMEVS